jgi:HK97 family phage major capsid protein
MNPLEKLLNERKELVNQAETFLVDGNIEEFTAKEIEVKALDSKIEGVKLAMANLNAMKDNTVATDLANHSQTIDGGGTLVAQALAPVNVLTNEKVYENAWAKKMMGQAVEGNELEVFNSVNKSFNNAYTHDTGNTAVLIPETVVAGIWSRAEEMYPLFADAKKFNVRGTLKIAKHLSIDAGDAAWYLEADVVVDEQNTFGEMVLNGHELAKAVTVSWKLKAMAVQDFIPYIINELGERVGVALGTGAVQGNGTTEPEGVETALAAEALTPQIGNYAVVDGITYADITGLIAKIHSSYTNGAAFYANNNTVWTKLATIVDGNGRPIFIPDATSGGVGRLFGFPVKTDAGVSDGNIVFGNPEKGYVVNTNEPFSIVTEDHAKARKTDYVAYAVIDGGVLDTKAFSMLTPTV